MIAAPCCPLSGGLRRPPSDLLLTDVFDQSLPSITYLDGLGTVIGWLEHASDLSLSMIRHSRIGGVVGRIEPLSESKAALVDPSGCRMALSWTIEGQTFYANAFGQFAGVAVMESSTQVSYVDASGVEFARAFCEDGMFHALRYDQIVGSWTSPVLPPIWAAMDDAWHLFIPNLEPAWAIIL